MVEATQQEIPAEFLFPLQSYKMGMSLQVLFSNMPIIVIMILINEAAYMSLGAIFFTYILYNNQERLFEPVGKNKRAVPLDEQGMEIIIVFEQ